MSSSCDKASDKIIYCNTGSSEEDMEISSATSPAASRPRLIGELPTLPEGPDTSEISYADW